jgi:hypothetical protein
MVPVAFILLVLVAVLVVAIVVSNPEIYDLSIFGAVIPVNSAGIFITGAVAMAVTILALLLLRIGIRRARLRRKQLKALEASGEAPGNTAGRDSTQAETESSPSPPAVAAPADTATSPASTTSGTAASTTSRTASTTPSTAASTKATDGDAVREKSALNLDSQSSTTTAERRAMLEEADELIRDEPQK